MTRNLKALGLAFAAMLALGAVMASAASAQKQGELTSDGPVTLTAEEQGTLMENAFTGAAGNVTCDGSIATGHKYNETPHEFLDPEGETTATVTPHYTDCEAHTFFNLITLPATVTMNGCDYVFHVGETTGEGETYGVTADLVCPEENNVAIHVYEDEAHEVSICTSTIHPQTGFSGPHLTNNEDHVDLKGTFTNIQETFKGPGCGHSEYTTNSVAKLHVNLTVSGHNEEGKPTPISISDDE